VADPATESDSSLLGSAERVRKSARWLLGSFGAVGLALAVGAQFSNVGKLQGNARDWALVGIGLTFAGLGTAIASGAAVLVPRRRSLTGLAERERRDRHASSPGPIFRLPDPALELFRSTPELLTPFSSVGELVAERTRLLNAYSKAYRAWSRRPTAAAKRALDKASDATELVEAVAWDVNGWANFSAVRATYTRALLFGVFPGVLVAGAGLTMFALKIPDVPPTAPTPAEVRLVGADLHGLDLRGAALHGADLSRTNLESANLTGADLSGAKLDGASLARANLAGANLEGATVEGTRLTGAAWSATTCPDGHVSDDVGGTCTAHLIPGSG
jgi:hypothetical protein